MSAHRLPPAEIIANPDALHELFIKSISADGSAASTPALESDEPPVLTQSGSASREPAKVNPRHPDHGSQP
jgi:hypothetical protein